MVKFDESNVSSRSLDADDMKRHDLKSAASTDDNRFGFGADNMKRRRLRSRLLAVFLFMMVGLFFFVTLAKLGFWGQQGG